MEPANLIIEASNLTLFGMGFVFMFLTLTVFIIKLMSFIVQKMQKIASVSHHGQMQISHRDEMEDELDEEAKFIIEQAIKMHRGA